MLTRTEFGFMDYFSDDENYYVSFFNKDGRYMYLFNFSTCCVEWVVPGDNLSEDEMRDAR